MNSRLWKVGLLAFGLALVSRDSSADKKPTICDQIVSAPKGHLVLTGNQESASCTATLTQDTVIQAGSQGAKLIFSGEGMLFRLAGHSLRIQGVAIDFSGNYGLAIHGSGQKSERAELMAMQLEDKSSVKCDSPQSQNRVGVVLYHLESAIAQVNLNDDDVRWGAVVAAPAGASPGSVHVLDGELRGCSGADPLVVNRRATLGGKTIEVETAGPDDGDPAKRNLISHGLP